MIFDDEVAALLASIDFGGSEDALQRLRNERKGSSEAGNRTVDSFWRPFVCFDFDEKSVKSQPLTQSLRAPVHPLLLEFLLNCMT